MSDTLTPPQAPTMPPAMQLMTMVGGFWTSQAVGVAARLGVADALAAGPLTAQDLAGRVNAAPDPLYRLLRALASVGVFSQHAANGTFGLTPLGETLRSDVPGSMRAMATMMILPAHWASWGELTHCVRTGRPGYEPALGTENIFDYFQENAEEAAAFNGAMTGLSENAIPAILASYDFGGFQTLMDVGGGQGALVQAVLAKHPALKGILFDMPSVIDGAPARGAAPEVAARLTRVGGDFFAALPAGADAIMMKHILHDWDDERAARILESCRAALPAGGTVLVVEMVVPPGDTPHLAKWMDLNMLAVTPGGRERTAEEFRALFDRAGFDLLRILPTQGPHSVIEAKRR